jgi:hypothetical protein
MQCSSPAVNLTSPHLSGFRHSHFPSLTPNTLTFSYSPQLTLILDGAKPQCHELSSHPASNMFYSHEGIPSLIATRTCAWPRILTRSRSSHVAQIWRRNRLVFISTCFSTRNTLITDRLLARLVATLGSKSNLKKVSRKAILDVDVVKTCDTIIEPAAPMALRLSSNLLWVTFPGVDSTWSRRRS